MPRAILTRIDFEAYGTHEDDVFAEGMPPADHDIPLARGSTTASAGIPHSAISVR